MTAQENPRLATEPFTGGPQTDAILIRLKELEARNVERWSIVALLVLIVVVGVFAFVLPNVMWNLGPLEVAGQYFPQIVFGCVTLIVLFNIYALRQRHGLRNARAELVRQLLRADEAEKASMTDALTGAFNRRYMERLLDGEVKRSHRTDSAFSLLLLDVNGFGAVNKKYGHLTGDRALKDLAEMLHRVFRLTDTVVRFGGDEFLVVLVDTDERTANIAKTRLITELDRWNRERNALPFTLSLTGGCATYTGEGSWQATLEVADAAMRRHKSSARSS